MKILALDPGSKTGWAVHNGTVESGVWDLSPRRGDSAGMRYVYLKTRLYDMAGDGYPDLVVYEQPHYRGGHASEVLGGMVGRIQEWCAEHGIEYHAVHSATLKKRATGSGRANKDDMMAEASKRVGREITDDNEADAVCLLLTTIEDLSLRPEEGE